MFLSSAILLLPHQSAALYYITLPPLLNARKDIIDKFIPWEKGVNLLIPTAQHINIYIYTYSPIQLFWVNSTNHTRCDY